MSATSAPDALISAPLDATAARELETAHRRLLHLHLEKELKSARVLRQIR
jgi:arginine/lysine/ornithine decarboxylase